MIKIDKGEIEISAGEASAIVLEWMQLTHSVSMAIKESTGIDMSLEMLIEYGTRLLNETENNNE